MCWTTERFVKSGGFPMNIEEVQRRLWEQSRAHKQNRESGTPLFPTNPYDGRIRHLMDLMHNPTWIAAACDRVLKRSRGKAAGVDGVRVSDFEKSREHRLEQPSPFAGSVTTVERWHEWRRSRVLPSSPLRYKASHRPPVQSARKPVIAGGRGTPRCRRTTTAGLLSQPPASVAVP